MLEIKDADRMLVEEMGWLRGMRDGIPMSMEVPLQRISVVGPAGPDRQTLKLPFQWVSRDEQHSVLHYVGCLARACRLQAVMVASDATSMDCTRVAEFLGITVPHDPATIQTFSDEYAAWFNNPLMDRNMRNLPEEFWEHALMVTLKTPGFTRVHTVHYRGDPVRDKPVYTLTQPPAEGESIMIPDWWTLADDHPGVLYAEKAATDILSKMLGFTPPPNSPPPR